MSKRKRFGKDGTQGLIGQLSQLALGFILVREVTALWRVMIKHGVQLNPSPRPVKSKVEEKTSALPRKKALSADLYSCFNSKKTPSSCDKTAINAASTLISLAAAWLVAFFFVFLCGF